MIELFEFAKQWIGDLGSEYGVNPLIFGSIYVGAIPLFAISMTWLAKNYRSNKSVVLPALSAMACFISAYVYLIIAGENVPWWVYGIMVLIVAYGAWTTFKSVRKKIIEIDKVITSDE